MRGGRVLRLAVLLALACLPALADLQNVEVGGDVRIRYNYWTSPAGPDGAFARNPLFQFPWTDSFRGVAGGNPFYGLRWPAQPGRFAIFSPVDWSDDGPNVEFVEQRTRLNLSADLTDGVSGFVELDSYDTWGTDFRSDYITGSDFAANTGDDVEVFQAYIQAEEMWGAPLRMRVGRQAISLGSEWLVGDNDARSFFRGLSFDGLRLTYATDLFSVDAIAAKLAETGALEEDGDVDFYALYGSYLGLEDITLDAYWMLVRDARSISDTNGTWAGEWFENILGLDDYDPTYLHTVGARGAGRIGAFDFEAEAAFQFGNADSVNSLFAGAGLGSPYGPDGEDFDNWAANAQVGYTFDMGWAPRAFLGGAYYGGEDDRDLNFREWLGAVFCPVWSAHPSLSFNRMFTDWQYSNFVDAAFHDCTNLWLAYGGVMVHPTEAVTVIASLAHVEANETYNAPWPTFNVLGTRFTPFSFFSFLDKENDKDLCWDFSLVGVYQYSENLAFEAGWSHMFVGDGASQGSFNIGNGLAFEGGVDDEDADYFYAETKLTF